MCKTIWSFVNTLVKNWNQFENHIVFIIILGTRVYFYSEYQDLRLQTTLIYRYQYFKFNKIRVWVRVH